MLFNYLDDSLKDRTPSIPNIGQVKAELKRLNPKKAAVEDRVPASVLKQFHEELAPVIHEIICTILQQSKIPHPYKYTFIPVPKMSNPMGINYDFRQPVMILPQIAKVLENFRSA